MTITASMVKELREKTAAGMMDCKKALEEVKGDMEAAIDWLRQKGLSKAAKRAGRATSEGIIGFHVNDASTCAFLVEVKCETDFVSRGEKFQEFAKIITDQVVENFPENKEALLAQSCHHNSAVTVQDLVNDAIATIGENIVLGRIEKLALCDCNATKGRIGSYLHSNGKIAVLAKLRCDKEATAQSPIFQELAKNISMQIAATSPVAISAEQVDPAILERERELYRQKAREEGKPDTIIEKIAEGAVKKYCKEICLLEQPYIRDDKQTIADLVKAISKELDDTIVIKGFIRIQLGAE